MREDSGHCPDCGYDLHGNIAGVCSECGKPFNLRPPYSRLGSEDH
jgi:hypothetical protein